MNGWAWRKPPGRTCIPDYVGHPDATGAINEHHFNRVMGYVDEARARGVEVISLNGDEPDAERRQIPMYVVIDPPEDSQVHAGRDIRTRDGR